MASRTNDFIGRRDLGPLLRPSSVAVIGASARGDALGNRVLRNLAAAGFPGRIDVIHPRESMLEGLHCHADLAGLPQAPECVAIALPAAHVLKALEQAAARGAKAAVVFASGFSEAGEAGRKLQRELADFCRGSGLLVCGPNVLGVRSLHQHFALYSAPLPARPQAGSVAVAAHSGSACVALSSTGRFGLSHVVSMGNSVALDADAYLDFFADDTHTRMACLFLEAVGHPDRLAAAAARMRAAGKPVVALKVGRTVSGAAASAAHTGSLASSHVAASAFFREAGIVLVDDLDEMIETCTLMATAVKRPTSDGVAVINISGGEVALTCDLAEELGLSLPALAPATAEALSVALPDYATPGNPLDATSAALADPAIYDAALRALLADPKVGMVAVSQDCPAGLSDGAAEGYRKLALVAATVARDAGKPMAFYSNVGGALHPLTVEPLHGSGVPVLQGARAALVAVRGFLQWHMWQRRPHQGGEPLAADPAWFERLASGRALTEHEAKRFLDDHGIRTTREILARTAIAAADAAESIGFPVVAKVHSADIAHKSEVGGVMLNLTSRQQVLSAFEAILASVRRLAPQAQLEGVVVQEMVRGGIEMIAGMAQHPPFGPGVIVGAGGVLVELLHDSAFALAPIDAAATTGLVGRTRACKLLDGYRGSPPADRASFERIVVKLGAIAHAYADVIEAIDLNPVAVLPEGRGACVLDALIVPRSTLA